MRIPKSNLRIQLRNTVYMGLPVIPSNALMEASDMRHVLKQTNTILKGITAIALLSAAACAPRLPMVVKAPDVRPCSRASVSADPDQGNRRAPGTHSGCSPGEQADHDAARGSENPQRRASQAGRRAV